MMRPAVSATIYNKKGKVIAVGHNSYIKTHPMQARIAKHVGLKEKIFLHAEIDALVRCKEPPYKIKIERYTKNGDAALAKPCPICELAIKRAGISVVEYTVGQ